jgi:hypothetical protein
VRFDDGRIRIATPVVDAQTLPSRAPDPAQVGAPEIDYR